MNNAGKPRRIDLGQREDNPLARGNTTEINPRFGVVGSQYYGRWRLYDLMENWVVYSNQLGPHKDAAAAALARLSESMKTAGRS